MVEEEEVVEEKGVVEGKEAVEGKEVVEEEEVENVHLRWRNGERELCGISASNMRNKRSHFYGMRGPWSIWKTALMPFYDGYTSLELPPYMMEQLEPIAGVIRNVRISGPIAESVFRSVMLEEPQKLEKTGSIVGCHTLSFETGEMKIHFGDPSKEGTSIETNGFCFHLLGDGDAEFNAQGPELCMQLGEGNAVGIKWVKDMTFSRSTTEARRRKLQKIMGWLY